MRKPERKRPGTHDPVRNVYTIDSDSVICSVQNHGEPPLEVHVVFKLPSFSDPVVYRCRTARDVDYLIDRMTDHIADAKKWPLQLSIPGFRTLLEITNTTRQGTQAMVDALRKHKGEVFVGRN